MHDMNSELAKRNGHVKKANPPQWDPDREPIEELAADFADRCRSGQRVSVEQFAQQHPEFADQLRELLPAVEAMERLNTRRVGSGMSAVGSLPMVEQLGDFRVIGEIARGGMGIVYEAEQVTLGRRVAVKVLPQQALRSDRDVQRFQREAQTAAKLHHTNIVPVFGVGEQDGTHYIVMQLIRGVGLDEILAELKRIVTDAGDAEREGRQTTSRSSRIKQSAVALLKDELRRDLPSSSADCREESASTAVSDGEERQRIELPASEAGPTAGDSNNSHHIRARIGSEYYRNVARIGLQAAHALSYAHLHGTLHRDVKPGNLLLDDEGVVWMADFGLAKAVEHNNVTWTGDIVGTLAYMAPERFQGTTDALSDIYSLGITLYELVTFERPYDGKDRVSVMHRVANEELPTPRKRNPHVSRDLETIVLKAAARNPSDRYRTAADLAADLECYLEDRPIQARRISPAEQFVRWCRRNRAVASLAATVMFLLATVLGVTLAGYVHATDQRHRAEATSSLAVSALDEIYGQFAPAQLNIPTTSTSLDEAEDAGLLGSSLLPLSPEVALLLENLLRFYDELSKQADDTERLAVKSISANRRVGDIRRRLGEFDLARSSYERAIQRIERLDAKVRDTPAVRLEYARIQNGLGTVLQQHRLHDDVVSAHRQAIDHLDARSSSANERFELARSLYLLHHAEQRRWWWNRWNDRSGEAGPPENSHIQRALAILGELRQSHPNLPDYRFLQARCFLACGSGCSADGTLNKSQSRAIAILEELVKSSPDVVDYRYELGDAYCSIEWREARSKRKGKRPAEELAKSESRLRTALEVTESLDTKHPNIPEYSILKKRLHHILAMVLKDANQLAEAEQHYRKAIEKQRLVVQQARDRHHQEAWLFDVELDHAQLLRDLGENEEAKERLHAIVEGLEKLANLPEIKENRLSRRVTEKTLAQSYVTLACVLHRLGEQEQADSVLRKAEKSGT